MSNSTHIPWIEFFKQENWYYDLFIKYGGLSLTLMLKSLSIFGSIVGYPPRVERIGLACWTGHCVCHLLQPVNCFVVRVKAL